jgi:hypothetical protein
MNEFEWRRQMRDLRQPVAPSPDLWARIDAALDREAAGAPPPAVALPPTAAPRRSRQPWLLAASFAALAAIAGGLALRLESTRAQRDVQAAAGIAATGHWKPGDPRLSGAAVELDAAQAELQQALHQAPASPALQRLLARTEQQQSRLRQMDHEAG